MTVLPFGEFLEALRDRGFAIGLHEYVSLGKLLDRWDRTDRSEMRNSLAALIARDEHEVREICEAFDKFYREAPLVEPPDGGDRRPDPQATLTRWLRRAAPWAALLAVALGVGYFILLDHWNDEVVRNVPVVAAPVSDVRATPAPRQQPTTVPPPSGDRIDLPAPPGRTDWLGVGWLALGAVVVTMLVLWAARMRAAARQWIVNAWRSELAELPGPFHGTFVMKDFVSRLPRADVEDAATVLSRAFSPDWRGNELDVPRSLRQTLRHGMQPHLIFKPRRVQEAILVLQDISQSMEVHARKVDSLNRDLRRQGVVLEHWYFDGDVALPARRPFGEPVPLAQLFRSRGDGPALVLSAGAGVPASLNRPDNEWLVALRRRDRLAWLNPITDPKLWPAALQRLPILVLPMTRAGLLHAAHALSHGDAVASRALGRVSIAPPVTASQIAQLRRLAAVVPYPTPEFLELLRQRFAPSTPESAVLYAVDARSASTNLPYRMSDDEIRAALGEMRDESPSLERRVREYLLKVLADSEPQKGSAAHLRWQASRAIHEVQLAALRGTDATAAVEALRRIHDGPLWEEVREIVGRQPLSGPATKLLRGIAGASGRTAEAPAFASRREGPPAEAFRWVGPGWRAPVVATLAAAVVAAAGSFTSPFRLQASHLSDAYSLEYVLPANQASPAQPGRLSIRANYPADRVPWTVQIYRDGSPWEAPVPIDNVVARSVLIDESATHLYDVRAVLPSGALAMSNPVFAPSVAVLIDVQPWARVTVYQTASSSEQAMLTGETPVSFALPFGSYELRLENGVNDPGRERIDVTANGPRTFKFAMPGFSPDDLLEQLSRAGRKPASAR